MTTTSGPVTLERPQLRGADIALASRLPGEHATKTHALEALILTGPWATLPNRVRADPAIAIVVDVCDLATGLVRQVIARGRAELLPFDVARGRRKLSRYLGQDEARWDDRFRRYLHDDPAHTGTVWLRLRPDSLVAQDLSYSV